MTNPFNDPVIIAKSRAIAKRIHIRQKVAKARAEAKAKAKAKAKPKKLNPNPLTTPSAIHKKYANVLK